MVKMNDGLHADVKTQFKSNIGYKYVKNQVTHEIIDVMGAGDRYFGHAAEVLLLTDEDVLTDKWKGVNLVK